MEVEEEEPEPEATTSKDGEEISYWKNVLGDAYEDHIKQLRNEEQDRLKKLGKGKRVRKPINYSERELLANAKISEEMKVGSPQN